MTLRAGGKTLHLRKPCFRSFATPRAWETTCGQLFLCRNASAAGLRLPVRWHARVAPPHRAPSTRKGRLHRSKALRQLGRNARCSARLRPFASGQSLPAALHSHVAITRHPFSTRPSPRRSHMATPPRGRAPESVSGPLPASSQIALDNPLAIRCFYPASWSTYFSVVRCFRLSRNALGKWPIRR